MSAREVTTAIMAAPLAPHARLAYAVLHRALLDVGRGDADALRFCGDWRGRAWAVAAGCDPWRLRRAAESAARLAFTVSGIRRILDAGAEPPPRRPDTAASCLIG